MTKFLAGVLSIFLLILAGVSIAPPEAGGGRAAYAAEFDIDSGRVVLRRLQYCTDCGSALLVTHVHPGEEVRCPDCGHEQPRLENKFLLTQLYQICKLCSGPLNPESRHAGDVVECATCHTRQPLVGDVFARGVDADGKGFRPGFPPGTGKKKLLLSPNKPDAAIAMIPLDRGSGELPLPDSIALRRIPEPPTKHEPPALPGAPVAPASPDLAAAAPPLPEIESRRPRAENGNVGESAPVARVQRRPVEEKAALDVPAVTADLFGGKRGDAKADAAYLASGRAVARVDGQSIYARDIERVVGPVVEKLRQQAGAGEEKALADRVAALRREVLERLIDRELVLREAAAIGYKPDPVAVRARETELAQILAGSGVDLRKEAVRDVTMADMRRRYAEKPASVTPKEVREFYQEHKGEMLRPRLVALDQLVVYEDRTARADRRNSQEIAFEIAGLLESGTKFDDLRRRYDEFHAAAEIEYAEPTLQPEGAYAKQVLLAGGDLRRNAVFGPVPMAGMILFVKVTDVRPAGPTPFEEVERRIRLHLESQKTEENFAVWLNRLRGKAKIEVL